MLQLYDRNNLKLFKIRFAKSYGPPARKRSVRGSCRGGEGSAKKQGGLEVPREGFLVEQEQGPGGGAERLLVPIETGGGGVPTETGGGWV